MEKPALGLKRHLPSLAFVAVAALLVGGVGGAIVYAGAFNIAADAPHASATTWLIERLRDRSIAVRARTIAPPGDLGDPKRVAAGAGSYAEMCSGCHLAPGMAKTELSQGLYPPAPVLPQTLNRTPSEQFWVIKHGVKMTGMPAWGRTHDDALIWDMVAFVRQLPTLSPERYAALTKNASQGHGAAMRGMADPPAPHGEPGHKH